MVLTALMDDISGETGVRQIAKEEEIKRRVDRMQACEHIIAYLGFTNDMTGTGDTKFFYML